MYASVAPPPPPTSHFASHAARQPMCARRAIRSHYSNDIMTGVFRIYSTGGRLFATTSASAARVGEE